MHALCLNQKKDNDPGTAATRVCQERCVLMLIVSPVVWVRSTLKQTKALRSGGDFCCAETTQRCGQIQLEKGLASGQIRITGTPCAGGEGSNHLNSENE